MKLIRKVSGIEIKRAFVVAQFIRLPKNKKRYLGLISEGYFRKRLRHARKKVLALRQSKLDKIIGDEYMKRLNAYNNSEWYLGRVSNREVGVWKRAGGLPLSWTKGSLQETAQEVKHALEINPKLLTHRARRTIINILETNVSLLQQEKYLLPIIFKHATGTNGRRGLKRRLKGDIDDGSMRSIALAVLGVKVIRAYIGFPNKLKQ